MTDEHTCMRAMTASDLPQTLVWRNHPDISRWMYSRHSIGIDEHRRWFERAIQDGQRHLLIFELDCRPMGFVQLTRLHGDLIADWGFYAAPDAPKGTGRLLGNCALGHAFGPLGLHKVCGEAITDNTRSVRLHLALGFTQEGLRREQHFDGTRYHDVLYFGLLAAEWSARPGTEKDTP